MVYGVDINELHRELLDLAREYINLSELPSNLEFFRVKPLEKISDKVKADVIFTWSVMEHVSRDILVDVIKEFYSILTPNGYVFIQIAPLYYSPEGAHFYGLTDEAWIHLKTQNNLLSKNIKNLPKEKSGYSMLSDDVYRNIIEGIWSTYETLNKVTAKELVSLFTSNGFRIVNEKYFHVDLNPPEQLLEIYQKEILTNYQMVVLFQKD